MNWKRIRTPLDPATISSLAAGDLLNIDGVLYTARDKAHERLAGLFAAGEPLPVDLAGQCIYYMGPSPAPAGRVIGAAGPTTSGRMDAFTEAMLRIGVRGMIGKGKRGSETRRLLREYGGIYLSSFGGAGAYLSTRIVAAEVAAFADLGPEAIYRLEVRDFPAVVINDMHGGDLYEDALRKRG